MYIGPGASEHVVCMVVLSERFRAVLGGDGAGRGSVGDCEI